MKNLMIISCLSVFFLVVFLFLISSAYKAEAGTISIRCCITSGEMGQCIGCGELEDCAITGVDCPLPPDALFFQGEICLTNNETQECKTPEGTEEGCCVISEANCRDSETIEGCSGEGRAWFLDTACNEVPECTAPPKNVPALSEWGIIIAAVIAGIIGFIVISRRKAAA